MIFSPDFTVYFCSISVIRSGFSMREVSAASSAIGSFSIS